MGITAEMLTQAEYRVSELDTAHQLHGQLTGPHHLLQRPQAEARSVHPQHRCSGFNRWAL